LFISNELSTSIVDSILELLDSLSETLSFTFLVYFLFCFTSAETFSVPSFLFFAILFFFIDFIINSYSQLRQKNRVFLLF